ncbi:hypothetical protein EVAR_68123_1 [Eumeta japonica]|uniref:Uncharacterized protein n=1 Tax=Eumeta variegata TaxID=151549 RepID=A0A4C1ZDL3_EUMVA|nr:hypothetical protein EVAR_68123_1 [Eumeta japonica]
MPKECTDRDDHSRPVHPTGEFMRRRRSVGATGARQLTRPLHCPLDWLRRFVNAHARAQCAWEPNAVRVYRDAELHFRYADTYAMYYSRLGATLRERPIIRAEFKPIKSKRSGSQNLSSIESRTVGIAMLFSDIGSGPYRNGRRYLAPLSDYSQRSAET